MGPDVLFLGLLGSNDFKKKLEAVQFEASYISSTVISHIRNTRLVILSVHVDFNCIMYAFMWLMWFVFANYFHIVLA